MSEYSIRDLEKLSGIKAHTIRIWEKRYNLVSPKRTSTNIRYYSDEDLKKLLNISILNRNGVKISKIAGLKTDELNNQVSSMARESLSHESQIEDLLVTMIELDETRFEKNLSKCIMQMGFEGSVLKVIYPFFMRIGLMWQTGNINPAQEHFISNLVRQKMMVAIDSIIPETLEKPKKFILFLPEGELHEIALLFLYYLIKRKGHKVFYLGQSIPLGDVKAVHKKVKADFMLTYFTSSLQHQDLQDKINGLAESFPDKTILMAGNQLETVENFHWKNVKRLSTPQSMLDFMKSMPQN